MKRTGGQAHTPDTKYASAFLPTTSSSPASRSAGPAISFSPAAAAPPSDDDDDDDPPNPNYADRPVSLPLFNTRPRMDAGSSSSSQHPTDNAPRRRGVGGQKDEFDPATLDLDGGLDEDEKRGLSGLPSGRAAARKEKPAYKPPAKTWVRLSC